jgi:hypothetical protein
VLVAIDERAYNTRRTSRDIDGVKTGRVGIVIDACQVKRPGGVIEVEADGAVSVKTK